MRILVFGAGALGSFIGGVLSKKYDVTLYGREEKILPIRESGLRINGKTNVVVRPKTAFDQKDLEGQVFDLIILAVKSYDTESAMDTVKDMVGQSTAVLSLQNGLDNEDIIGEVIGKERTLGGVTSHGITFIEPGEVHHAGTGETVIGELNGEETERIKEISTALTSVGIETRISKNIESEIWTKGIVNAGINPLTALTRLQNGYLLKIPWLTRLLENTCQECIRVANKAGIDLPGCDIIEKTKNVAKLTAENKSSMLQDIERGRRTEIDSINGAIVDIGKKHNVETPVSSTLVSLIKGIEEGRGR
ncbi:MAG: 2-dehydropantoate 2-reductase [Thermoplasmata archaeon]